MADQALRTLEMDWQKICRRFDGAGNDRMLACLYRERMALEAAISDIPAITPYDARIKLRVAYLSYQETTDPVEQPDPITVRLLQAVDEVIGLQG